MVDDFTGWHRAGRGRSFQFYATDDEIAEWLLEMLQADFAPYVVFREKRVGSRLVVHERNLDDIERSFADDRNTRHWIKSAVLSPGLHPEDISAPNDVGKLSFNGLIAVRLGADWKGRREAAELALIDRVRNDETAEERRRSDYLRIFERLRRSLRKRLVVNTEDWPMTARAAAAHASGEVTFAASPSEHEDMSSV